MDVLQMFLILVFGMCKVDYDNEDFILTPMFTCNKVMQLLELVSIVDYE